TVVQVHRAGHAVTLDVQGLELILHVGLDTVALGGRGFTPLVRAGERVRAATPLLRFDADAVARGARSLVTPVLVTSMDRVAALDIVRGRVRGGHDILMTVTRADGAPAPVTRGGDTVRSPALRITAPTGLHARPASVLAATARRFSADLRLAKGGRDANVRSVVSIMALEVLGGDRITITGQGSDAAAAVGAITDVLLESLAELAGDAAAPEASPAAPVSSAPQRVVRGAPRGAQPLDDAPLPTQFAGVAASPGLAVGPAVVWRRDEVEIEPRAADANHERRALDHAVAAAHLQLEALRGRLAAAGDADRAAIFAAHQELLEDPDLLDAAAHEIRAGASAAWGWREAFTGQAARLDALDNQMLAGRAADLRDVGRRVLAHLVGRDDALRDLPEGAILVAEELTPSDTMALDRTRVRGLATVMGSATSHAAILARGLGLPAVAGLDPRVLRLPSGTPVLLDGAAGTLGWGLSEAQAAAARADVAAEAERQQRQLAQAAAPAVTTDGQRVEVAANLGDAHDASRVVEVGGEGVGLLRSEFVFLERRDAPSEDEQAATYSAIARALGPTRRLVVRTLDVGGDKPLPYLPMPAEENPMLGLRGIRLALANPETLRPQVRAVLRAARDGKVALMFPMIATLAEFRAAKAIVETERAALGVPPVEVGLMVETTAAALMADQFAREADFLSVGTNDLTQYTLAMDRGHPQLAPQVDALHPSVLRLIDRAAQGAHLHQRWIGVCGALAGDLVAVPVLLGLGVDELSVDLPLVPAVKARVRGLAMAACRETARLALDCEDGATVRALVAERHGRR
nr:phosphoenolpyruvate--protein phosphotransferase [Gemmatimonadaceae bacterium]